MENNNSSRIQHKFISKDTPSEYVKLKTKKEIDVIVTID